MEYGTSKSGSADNEGVTFCDQTLTRAQAKKLGVPMYYTGKPCAHGHVAERYTVNANCYECTRLWNNRGRDPSHDRRLDRRLPRDERGWIIPNVGTQRRRIYDCMVRGLGLTGIVNELAIGIGIVKAELFKIRNPDEYNANKRVFTYAKRFNHSGVVSASIKQEKSERFRQMAEQSRKFQLAQSPIINSKPTKGMD